ncbi:MAG TPA: nicotinate phosphoribosyltransferase [Jatrophihabitans sp.]|nr:nicotinate phosphoribosyltransferase [Jatrophihabitans sp.]
MASALSTDLYELTMTVSYLRRRMTAPATFSLLVRNLPSQRGFLVSAGLSDCLDFLSGFRFTDDELAYVGELLQLPDRDVRRLAGLRFTGDVWAVPEGHVVSGGTPLLEVTAPLPEAQLVETALLNFVTFQTAVASKAARCRLAAPHAQLIDFGMRRTQSLQAAMQVARASAIAGFDATSNVAAARRFGLVASGTMAHSYVQAFPNEAEAFRAFAADFPSRAVFLVDTYDTLAGTAIAAEVAKASGLGASAGIRLDSGDLAELAFGARRILDAAGVPAVRIVASGGLDEYALDRLVRAGAPIDAYGVGTRLGTSADAPYLDTAYKLVEYDGRPVFKLSPGKATTPGRKQVFRSPGLVDSVGIRDEVPPAGTRPLLQQVMRGGERTAIDSLAPARARCAADLAELSDDHRRLQDPVPLFARWTPQLLALAAMMKGPESSSSARTTGERSRRSY